VTPARVAVGGRGVVDPAEPVLRADDEALLRGRAAFETVRVYDGTAVPPRRASATAREVGGAHRSAAGERLELEELAPRRSKLQGADAVLRLVWTPARRDADRAGARQRARRPYDALRERGQR
jgi:hypothetical protein